MPSFYTSPLLTDVADGAQILNSTVETIMFPDFTFLANDPRLFQGAYFTVLAYFDISNVVTTPGNVTFRARWGGGGGTILAASAAIALSATARTSFSGKLEIEFGVRGIGAAGSIFAQGEVHLNDVPVAADSAPQSIYSMGSAGANVPAVVGSLDMTTAKALSITAQFSVNTATTQLTNHLRRLTSHHS